MSKSIWTTPSRGRRRSRTSNWLYSNGLVVIDSLGCDEPEEAEDERSFLENLRPLGLWGKTCVPVRRFARDVLTQEIGEPYPRTAKLQSHVALGSRDVIGASSLSPAARGFPGPWRPRRPAHFRAEPWGS